MKVIGLTGGIGSGKSTVGQIMSEREDVLLLMSDNLGHLCMQKTENSYQEIVSLFGESILNVELEIDRNQLSKVVFSDKKKLEQLNQIIHPWVKNYIVKEIEKARKTGRIRYFIIESAILLEAGYEDICDEFWYVYASEEVRRERLKSSRGYSEEKIDNILKNQLSKEEFCNKCSHIISTEDGDLERVQKQVEVLLV